MCNLQQELIDGRVTLCSPAGSIISILVDDYRVVGDGNRRQRF